MCLCVCYFSTGTEGLTLSPPIPLTLYTLPYWSNPPFLIFDIRALWRSWLSVRAPKCQKLTRSSATAEKPRDALRQLKYYGGFLTELLTRSSANPDEPCEHTVSWNRVKCFTNVRRIACENVCNRWMTFKAIQGHCRCHHLIGHILFPISLPL